MNKKIMLTLVTFFIAGILFFTNAYSNEYYVDRNYPTASDGNLGSKLSPWKTIQHAATVIRAGDICYVIEGDYDEFINIQNSGQRNKYITFVSKGRVITKGFELINKMYIRIIGFEITNIGGNRAGIYFAGAYECEIWNNYIHHVPIEGIRLHPSSISRKVKIIGNKIQYSGYNNMGNVGIEIFGDSVLVEYNDISHVADYVLLFGKNNIVRNNFFHDSFWSDWPGTSPHIDGIQHYASTWYPTALKNAIIERNYMYNIKDYHTHFMMLSNKIPDFGSSGILVRNNLVNYIGDYFLISEEVDNVRVINNTVANVQDLLNPKDRIALSFTNYANGCKVLNNIFYNCCRDGGSLYSVDESSKPTFRADYNLAYLSGDPREVHGILDHNPLFRNYETNQLHLRSDSPAIDVAGPITKTVNRGNGSTISVEDAFYFCDGWGMVEGDYVKIGTNNPVKIEQIDYKNNILRVNADISWNIDDKVYYTYNGSGPEMGAFEYNENYGFNINISNPINGAKITGEVRIEAEVANESCIRRVIYFINGIPQEIIFHGPYSYIWNTNGLLPGNYIIEVKAYSLYPGSELTKSDQISVTLTNSNLVPPRDLRFRK